jgi:hypothetical protein
MNTIDEQETGDKKTITGITNLQPGKTLQWMITETSNETGSDFQSARGITNVIPGTKGINRWSAVFDTAHMKPARYRVFVTEDIGNSIQGITPDGGMSAISEFNLTPPASGTKNTTDSVHSPDRFVTIDTLPDIRINDIYLITGTTSLPAGEDLRVRVYPVSFMSDYNFTLNPKDQIQDSVSSGATGTLSGAGSKVRIVQGNATKNLWSFELRTYRMEPGRYEVNVCNDKSDAQLKVPVPGDVSSSKKFTLRDDT